MAQDDVVVSNVVSLESATVSAPAGADQADVAKGEISASDCEFLTELGRLHKLTNFVNNQAVLLPLSEDDSWAMGELLKLNPNGTAKGGRSSTVVEWKTVTKYNQLLFRALSEHQRRQFLIGEMPNNVAKLPIWFAAGAFACLALSIIALFSERDPSMTRGIVLTLYVAWLIALGAMGSIAFIGMNALSVQQDITFDLLNQRLITLRIVLGSLFALVLALPFGFDGYYNFLLRSVNPKAGAPITSSDALMLILPFLLGFSTSLVIMILNRLIEAAQSFFGRTFSQSAAPPQIATNPHATMISWGTGSGEAKPSRAKASRRTVTEPLPPPSREDGGQGKPP